MNSKIKWVSKKEPKPLEFLEESNWVENKRRLARQQIEKEKQFFERSGFPDERTHLGIECFHLFFRGAKIKDISFRYNVSMVTASNMVNRGKRYLYDSYQKGKKLN